MNKPVKLIVAVLFVIVMVAITLIAVNREENKEPSNNNATTSSESGTATTITYDGSGFSPADVTVAAGSKLKFVNNSDETVEPSSDDHPTHTKNTELNVGDVEAGQSKEIIVNTKGMWGMHNHYEASEKLTVTVE